MGNLALMNLSRMAPEILETRKANLDRVSSLKGESDIWEDLGAPEESLPQKETPKLKPRLAVVWE